MYFDSHCHLESERFAGEADAVLANMLEAGVDRCICAGSDMATSAQIVELCRLYAPVYGTVGVHPHEAKHFQQRDLQQITAWLELEKIVGIGEIGLDYYYDYSDRDTQRSVLRQQIELGIDLDVPLMFHVRDAHGDMMEMLKPYRIRRGVMHCYSGSLEVAKEYIKRGFIISFAGPITFKNAAKLPEIAAYVPMDQFFIETDSPYLAPVPHRGKRNEPAYVVEVAKKIAEVKGCTVEEIAVQTYQNVCGFYGIE